MKVLTLLDLQTHLCSVILTCTELSMLQTVQCVWYIVCKICLGGYNDLQVETPHTRMRALIQCDAGAFVRRRARTTT